MASLDCVVGTLASTWRGAISSSTLAFGAMTPASVPAGVGSWGSVVCPTPLLPLPNFALGAWPVSLLGWLLPCSALLALLLLASTSASPLLCASALVAWFLPAKRRSGCTGLNQESKRARISVVLPHLLLRPPVLLPFSPLPFPLLPSLGALPSPERISQIIPGCASSSSLQLQQIDSCVVPRPQTGQSDKCMRQVRD